MKRREFLRNVSLASASSLFTHPWAPSSRLWAADGLLGGGTAEVVIAGGGLGGCAAALAALRNGMRVILTEETDWLGGQLTSQGVPPDEHGSIESYGATRLYRTLRTEIREYYRRHYPLSEAARETENLDPGNGSVSRLCHEPRVALAVLESMLAPYRSGGQLQVLLNCRPVAAEVQGDQVQRVHFQSTVDERYWQLEAPWFIDATELGDLLPLTGTEFVTGAESRAETGELHAAEKGDPLNQQAFTVCFALDHLAGEEHVIEKPERYEFWRDYVPQLTPPWPGRLLDFTYTHPSSLKPKELGFGPEGKSKAGTLNLWIYRRIADQKNFRTGTYPSDISLINWPQNDYLLGNLVGVEFEERQRHIQQAKQLSLSLLYWLQTEAPRADGGAGWPGLRLRRDIMGTADGMAKFPYIREARRIRALFTVLEKDCGRENRALATGQDASKVTAAEYPDSVGVGSYHIDLHPSSGGDNYIDFRSLPFEIPLGALVPRRMRNLLPASKNIGTTHVTNGCYRLHPVEWNIGESVGTLAAFCQDRKTWPHAVREKSEQLAAFQDLLMRQGVELKWPRR